MKISKSRILIVAADKTMQDILFSQLKSLGHAAACVPTGRDALHCIAGSGADIVLAGQELPDMDSIQLMQTVHEHHPHVQFVIFSTEAAVNQTRAREVELALQKGAFDFLEEPLQPERLAIVLQRIQRFAELTSENTRLREHYRSRFSFHNIVTCSPLMQQTLEVAARVAASPSTTVSITGESGTGKEVLARAIHFESGCLPTTFVAVNCASIPETLMESELFGHVRGAFTGAERDREGKFSLARGGTILLDEIGDMPLALQAKFLRVLEERCFEKVGSNTPIDVDFRVIVATHRNLAEMVLAGTFREDLFHRINVVPITVPPLRERPEDIPPLADYFLNIFRKHQGKPLPGISRKALDMILEYDWPGNIRQLRNVLEYASIMVTDELIRPEHLRLNGNQTGAPGCYSAATGSASSACSGSPVCANESQATFQLSIPFDQLSLDNIVSQALETALEQCGGNKSKAAKLLHVNRKMFYRQS